MDLFDGEGLEFGHVQNLDARRQRRDIADRIAALEKKSRQRPPADRQCPHCGGELAKVGVSRCQHCGQEIDWAFGKSPCKPGEKYDLEQRIAAQNREEKKRKAQEAKWRKESNIVAEIKRYESSGSDLAWVTFSLGLCVCYFVCDYLWRGIYFGDPDKLRWEFNPYPPLTHEEAMVGWQYMFSWLIWWVVAFFFAVRLEHFRTKLSLYRSPHPHPDHPKAKHNNSSVLAKERAEELRKQAMQRRREAQKKKKSKQS